MRDKARRSRNTPARRVLRVTGRVNTHSCASDESIRREMTYRGPVDSQAKKLLRDDAPRPIRRSAFLACAPVRIIVATDVVGDTFHRRVLLLSCFDKLTA